MNIAFFVVLCAYALATVHEIKTSDEAKAATMSTSPTLVLFYDNWSYFSNLYTRANNSTSKSEFQKLVEKIPSGGIMISKVSSQVNGVMHYYNVTRFPTLKLIARGIELIVDPQTALQNVDSIRRAAKLFSENKAAENSKMLHILNTANLTGLVPKIIVPNTVQIAPSAIVPIPRTSSNSTTKIVLKPFGVD